MQLSTLSLIAAIIIAALIAVAVTWAMASLKLDKISGEYENIIAEKENTNRLQTEQIGRFFKYDAQCRETIKRKNAEIEMLNNVIVRMRTQPEAVKLLKERLPYGMTNTIRFMDYRKITDETTAQYRLQQECTTDSQGIRRYGDYICVALGSAYGQDIGDTWHVTLKCGAEFDIIYAEHKDDGVTDFFGHDDVNYDEQDCTNVIEFVVDEEKIPSAVEIAGTFTKLDYFGGLYGDGANIIEMKYTGRVWE